jgi:GntR family transcriptional regulator, transcriptional repressor for pyruvate dehydrogenase complex
MPDPSPKTAEPPGSVPQTDRVEQALEEMIVTGQLEVGSRLPGERTLMERLGVSRPVVREAIGRLKGRGLLRVYPSRGTFVTGTPEWGIDAQWQSWMAGDRERALMLNEVSACLNSRAAELAAQRCSEADLAELRLANTCFAQQCERGAVPDIIHWDRVFHYRLALCSGNPVLASFVKDIHDAMKATHRSTLADPHTTRASLTEHAEIVAAIEARDPERAMRAVSVHEARSRDEILRETSDGAESGSEAAAAPSESPGGDTGAAPGPGSSSARSQPAGS